MLYSWGLFWPRELGVLNQRRFSTSLHGTLWGKNQRQAPTGEWDRSLEQNYHFSKTEQRAKQLRYLLPTPPPICARGKGGGRMAPPPPPLFREVTLAARWAQGANLRSQSDLRASRWGGGWRQPLCGGSAPCCLKSQSVNVLAIPPERVKTSLCSYLFFFLFFMFLHVHTLIRLRSLFVFEPPHGFCLKSSSSVFGWT